MQKTILLIPGASYYLQNCATKTYLTGGSGNSTSVAGKKLDADNPFTQQWILDMYETNGTQVFSFIQKGNGARLYMSSSDIHQQTLSATNSCAGWTLHSKTGDCFYLQNYNYQSNVLSQNSHNSNIKIGGNGTIDVNEKWWLYLADVEVTAEVQHIEYGTVTIPQTQRTMIDSGTISNTNAKASVSVDVSINKSISSSFSWALNESITLGISDTVTVEGQVGVPFVANGKITNATTINASTTIGSNQTWETTEGVDFSANMSISVPPQSTATYNGYVNMAQNIQSNFVMYLKIKATCTTNNVALTGQQIYSLLGTSGYNNLNDVRLGNHSVGLSIPGTFTGSYGTSVYIEVV